ncbi:MAG: hypothetical protein J0G28_08805 [Afipia sp.]|nr:hypothetical protein [Afipia sp.]OJW61932.1 MAG: hypothetical protein BGO65_01940 [Afipia sp. 64-13]
MLVQAGVVQAPLVAQTGAARMDRAAQDANGQAAGADDAATAGSGIARYDFSSMSPAQMRDTVNRLIRSGDLSLDETGNLLSIMAPPSARLRVDGTQVPATEAERIDNTPVDAFAMLREGIAGARWRNDSASEAALTRTIAALQRVQGTVSSVDIRA